MARVAGLLHLAEHGLERDAIDETTMRNALRIGEYFFAHGLAALSAPDEMSRRAQLWLGRHDETTVSQRDLQRGPLGGRGTAAQAEELAQTLVVTGALRKLEEVTGARPGRPAGPTYAINPNLQSQR